MIDGFLVVMLAVKFYDLGGPAPGFLLGDLQPVWSLRGEFLGINAV